MLFKRHLIKKMQHVMMESLSLKKENLIKDKRNIFRLKRIVNYTAIKELKNILD